MKKIGVLQLDVAEASILALNSISKALVVASRRHLHLAMVSLSLVRLIFRFFSVGSIVSIFLEHIRMFRRFSSKAKPVSRIEFECIAL